MKNTSQVVDSLIQLNVQQSALTGPPFESNEVDSPSEAPEDNQKQRLVCQTPVNELRKTEKGFRVGRAAADDLLLAELEQMSDYKQDERLKNSQYNIGTRVKKNPTTDRSDCASNSAGSNLSSVGEMLNLQNYFTSQGKNKNIQSVKNQTYQRSGGNQARFKQYHLLQPMPMTNPLLSPASALGGDGSTQIVGGGDAEQQIQ